MTTVPSISTWFALPESASGSASFATPPAEMAAPGDVIVIALAHWENTTVDHPRGFTRKSKTGTRRGLLSVYWYRIPDTGDVPDMLFTITDDGSPGLVHPCVGFLWVVRGAAPDGDPFEAVCDLPIRDYVDTDTPTVQLTTTNPNTLLLFCSSHATPGTLTAPDGFHLFSNASTVLSFAAGVKNNPTAGPTGPISGTWDSVNSVSAWLGAVRPAGAPPPQPLAVPRITLAELARDIGQAKDDAYLLAAEPDTTTQAWLKQCWQRLDAALWCVEQASPKIKNNHPDQRGLITPTITGNPIEQGT